MGGHVKEFQRHVQRAFKALKTSSRIDALNDFGESLVVLAEDPARFREVSTSWIATLEHLDLTALTPPQWRRLAQVSGMMGLFRANNLMRLRCAESSLLPSAGGSADVMTRTRALCELDRADRAVEELSESFRQSRQGVPHPLSRAICAYLERLCRRETGSPGLAAEDVHFSRLRTIVAGRRVGIIGNSASMPDTFADEDVDVVVRLNVFKALERDVVIGTSSRPLIVYMNSGQSQRLLRELNEEDAFARSLIASSALIVLRAKLGPMRADVFSVASARPPIHNHGPVIGCQAVFDVVVAGAKSVKLLGFDFNQSSLIGEEPWKMCHKLGAQGMLSQFEFLRQLHAAGILDCDDAGAATIRRSTIEYAALLEDLYGDWSVTSPQTVSRPS